MRERGREEREWKRTNVSKRKRTKESARARERESERENGRERERVGETKSERERGPRILIYGEQTCMFKNKNPKTIRK